ncbi:MAG TPA: hypothetical protein VII44_09750, partial [Puia sp.]
MNTDDEFRHDPSEELAKRVAYLINGYIRNKLTVSEQLELDEWVSFSMENQQLFEKLTDPAKEIPTFLAFPPMQKGASFNLEAVKA